MNVSIKYFLFSFAFIFVGLLVGFKIKDNFSNRQMLFPGKAQGLEKLHHAIKFIETNYVQQEDQEEVIDNAIKGIMEGLDPHSFYIPASERRLMDEQMEGSFEGIGVEFDIVDDTIYVEYPIPEGPSSKVGIEAGDRIVSVDGKKVAGIGITDKMVLEFLKGPKGTEVEVDVARRGVSGLLNFTIKRDVIPLYSVSYSYMVRPQTGYIKVNRFSETTYKEFREHLQKLLDRGMENLILDLRGNPGGYMTMAYKMADEFLSEGKLIVSTEGRIDQSKQKYESTSSIGAFEEGALIVLIDYGSASASEIVAGAVQDHDRGLIVGVRSFGKGLVQIQEDFEDGSAIRLVISEYYTPSGRCIQKPYDKGAAEYEHEIADRFLSGEIFDESKISFPDSLKFKTHSGRTVYGGGGIYPDIFVSSDTMGSTSYFASLQRKDLFRDFAAHYVDEHPSLKNLYQDSEAYVASYQISPDLMDRFIAFAADQGVPFSEGEYVASMDLIENRIKAYMGRRLYNDDGFYPVYLGSDNVLQRALALIPVAITLENTGTVQYTSAE